MTIIVGDCREVLATLEAGSIDAVITDPPYELGFMGRQWDSAGVSFDPDTWRAVLRVLKPGGHLLAFGGTRTYHRIVCAIEDAGFEIRDQLAWLFGSGFPKSLDVAKAIDRANGVEREDKFEGSFTRRAGPTGNRRCEECGKWLVSSSPCRCPRPQDAAVSEQAREWQGWGTALKPAHEPIVLARKPLVGTVAANVAEHGTGALNIDACRIETTDALGGGAESGTRSDQKGNAGWARPWMEDEEMRDAHAARVRENVVKAEALGRWPANVVLDEEAAAMLDAQTSPSVSRIGNPRASAAPGDGWGMTATGAEYDDQGGPSRFFYCAKTSRAERNAGLEPSLFEEQIADPYAQHRGRRMVDQSHISGNPPATGRNNHPTVKPITLMRWLTRLITPPGGIILDPFTGSGTTGCACALEGFEFLGVELDPEYVRIAEARIAFWAEHGDEALRIVAESERAQAEREVIAESGQLDLLG